MKKFIVFLLFVAAVWSLYTFNIIESPEPNEVIYHDSFTRVDGDFWFVGEWQTNIKVPHKLIIEDGVLNMPVNETDRGPYMLSKPIPLEGKTVVYIKRKVLQHYGNDNFTGGLALFETDDYDLMPRPKDDASLNMGNALFLVEYVHDMREDATRPGTDTFRVLPTNWKDTDNYLLIRPVFDEWFIEEIEYHTDTGELIYTIDERSYTIKTNKMKAKSVRLFMHSYGQFTGHNTKMEYLDIKLMNPE